MAVLLRVAYLGVTNAVALLRLMAMSRPPTGRCPPPYDAGWLNSWMASVTTRAAVLSYET